MEDENNPTIMMNLPVWMMCCLLLAPLAVRDVSTLALIKGNPQLCNATPSGQMKKEATGNLILGGSLLALTLTAAACKAEAARAHLTKIIGLFAIISALVGLYNVAGDTCAQGPKPKPPSSGLSDAWTPNASQMRDLDWIRLSMDGLVVGATLGLVLYVIKAGAR